MVAFAFQAANLSVEMGLHIDGPLAIIRILHLRVIYH
jgi:hypothetical protein